MPQNLNRGYDSSTAFLQIDGTDAGPVRSVEGGEPFATVVQSPVGPDGVVGKRVGSVRYAPIVLRAGVTGSYRALFDWIAEVLAGKQTPKSGHVLFADYQARTGSALEWDDGLITEVVFPAADASSAEEDLISVTIEPDAARLVSASGPVPSLGIGGKGGLGTARFSAANFAFEISGLEPDCKRVQRVESIVVRQPVVTSPAGVSLVPARTPGPSRWATCPSSFRRPMPRRSTTGTRTSWSTGTTPQPTSDRARCRSGAPIYGPRSCGST